MKYLKNETLKIKSKRETLECPNPGNAAPKNASNADFKPFFSGFLNCLKNGAFNRSDG